MTRIAARSLAFASLLALSACGGGLSRTFGLTRDAPDEFRVTTQAPLSMPPDFALRPPEPGAPRPQNVPDRRQAEEALVPQVALGNAAATPMSPGQEALVAAAGPPAPPNIRQKVAADSHLEQPSQGFAERLMFWRPTPPAGVVVDATRESQRLREDAALGRSPDTGETPIIQPKSPSLLGSIANIF